MGDTNNVQNNKCPTQVERIINFMKSNGSITQIQALTHLGVMRLASRISEIRKSGIDVYDEFVVVINRYGERCNVKKYWLANT